MNTCLILNGYLEIAVWICKYKSILNVNTRGADKSLARSDWKKKTIERSPFFVRSGGHCCRGDLVERTTF